MVRRLADLENGDRYCTACLCFHPRAEFYKMKDGMDGLASLCKKASVANTSANYVKRKREVWTILGNKCACCGFDKDPINSLTIGHPNGDGNEDRRKNSTGTHGLLLEIIKNGLEREHEIQLECKFCNPSLGNVNNKECIYKGKIHPHIPNPLYE